MDRKYILGVLKWTTQFDGDILVSKMTKSHLTNTVKFLRRKKKKETTDKWIELLSYELEKR